MNQPTPESRIERIEFVVTALIQIAILVIAMISLTSGLWLTAFTAVVMFLLTYMPSVIEHQLRLQLPVEISVFTSVFLFASFVLGEIGDFYERLWWWDIALHASSAFVIGLIGFMTVYAFYMTHRVRIAPKYVAAISFGAAITVGTLWEIFEFLMDLFFGFNMQKSGLVDTMTDLIVNSCGAMAAAAIGFAYVRYGEESPGRRFIRSIVERDRSHRAR